MKKLIEFIKGTIFITKSEAESLLNKQSKEFDEEVRQAVKSIDEDGIWIKEDFYSSELCKSIIAEFEEKMKTYASKVWKDDEGADHRLHGIDRVSESVKKFYTDAFITNVMSAYLATKIKITGFTLAGKIRATPSNLGSGGGWHRDIIYGKQFKAIMYLTDTTPENGPFQYLLKTHKHSSIIDTILSNSIGARQNRLSEQNITDILSTKKYELKTITGKAGSLILTDTSGIHRGKPIEEGTRYALTNYYFEGDIPSIFDIIETK